MSFLDDLMNDFRFNFLRDTSTIDIILVVILIIPLILTFMSAKIASKFKEDEKEIMRLSLKIKSVALIIVAILALIITQV
jgi:hypothetical protein